MFESKQFSKSVFVFLVDGSSNDCVPKMLKIEGGCEIANKQTTNLSIRSSLKRFNKMFHRQKNVATRQQKWCTRQQNVAPP